MFDAIGALLAPVPAGERAPDVGMLAGAVCSTGHLPRPLGTAEAAAFRLAATRADHDKETPWARRHADVAVCDAAVRHALDRNESSIATHLPEFRLILAGRWEADASDLLESPARVPPSVLLRHLPIIDGKVPLSLNALHYHAVSHLLGRLPSPDTFPPTLLEGQENALRAFARLRQERERRISDAAQQGDDATAYPPCVRSWLRQLKLGIHLKHHARFNLMAFLGRMGWPAENLVELFGSGYDGNEIQYQARNITARRDGEAGYAPMGCGQLRQLGLCPDRTCPGPTPLVVYARTLERKKQVRAPRKL